MDSVNNQKQQSLGPIQVIGVPAGGVAHLPSSIQKLILASKKIAGSKRILSESKNWLSQQKGKGTPPLTELYESNNTTETVEWLKSQKEEVILLASGDPLWFGIGRVLIENLPARKLIFHPSTTSLQLAFAHIGRPWQDATWVSLHGRDTDQLTNLLQKRTKAIVILTDPKRGGPKEVKSLLKESGMEANYIFWLFEKLGHTDEKVHTIMPNKQIPNTIDPLNLVVLIKSENHKVSANALPLFGIEDSLFYQHEDRPGLMTKREVRVQILADLELPQEGVLWDIGAGVGSIGLEALRIRPKLKLLSIDKRVGSKNLIINNANRLFVNPSAVIEAEASEVLKTQRFPDDLYHPDRIILGGGRFKEKEELIQIFVEKINSKGIIIFPLTTLQALNQIEGILQKLPCTFKTSQHQNYRGVNIGNGTRLSPMNPVFIIKAKFK